MVYSWAPGWVDTGKSRTGPQGGGVHEAPGEAQGGRGEERCEQDSQGRPDTGNGRGRGAFEGAGARADRQ